MAATTPTIAAGNGLPDDVALFPADVVGDPVVHPVDVPEPRKGGRPRGSKTDPRKLAAARKLQGKPPPGPGRPSNSARTSAELTRQLAAGYEMVGAMFVALGAIGAHLPPRAVELLGRFVTIGHAVKANATECAESVVNYSERSPRLRQALERSGQSASLIGILVAHLPIALAVLAEPAPPTPAPDGYDPTTPTTIPPEAIAEATRLADAMFASMFPNGATSAGEAAGRQSSSPADDQEPATPAPEAV
jgi:hypothetical protein